MVSRVRRVCVQLHDPDQSQHCHRRYDQGEEQRAKHTDVRELYNKFQYGRRKGFLRKKSNFTATRCLVIKLQNFFKY